MSIKKVTFWESPGRVGGAIFRFVYCAHVLGPPALVFGGERTIRAEGRDEDQAMNGHTRIGSKTRQRTRHSRMLGSGGRRSGTAVGGHTVPSFVDRG